MMHKFLVERSQYEVVAFTNKLLRHHLNVVVSMRSWRLGNDTNQSWPTAIDVGALVKQVASSLLVSDDDYIVAAKVGADKRTILLDPFLKGIPNALGRCLMCVTYEWQTRRSWR
jgi:hypothetical protein